MHRSTMPSAIAQRRQDMITARRGEASLRVQRGCACSSSIYYVSAKYLYGSEAKACRQTYYVVKYHISTWSVLSFIAWLCIRLDLCEEIHFICEEYLWRVSVIMSFTACCTWEHYLPFYVCQQLRCLCEESWSCSADLVAKVSYFLVWSYSELRTS